MNEFRRRALALPRASEQPHHGSPSFRVAGKIFAQLSADEASALLKLPLALQAWGTANFPTACIPEGGRWGRSGWTKLVWAELPIDALDDMISAAWSQVAPADLVRHQT